MIATTESRTTGLYFTTEGFSPLTNELWNDVVVSATYDKCTSQVGISPRYLNDNFYLVAYLKNDGVETKFYVDSFMRGTLKRYVDTAINFTFPATIKCEIKGSYYIFYVNNTVAYKMEFSSIPEAKVMLYASATEQCTSATIEEPQATGWTTNGTAPGVTIKQSELEDETQQWFLQGTTTQPAIIYRDVANLSGNYTLSFNVDGKGTAKLADKSLALNGTGQRVTLSNAITGTGRVQFESTSSLKVYDIQLENGLSRTSYIPTDETVKTREESSLSYPAKNNLNVAEGTMYMSVIPKVTVTSATLFYTDTNEMSLKYASGNFTFTVLTQSVSVPLATWNSAAEIFIGWENNVISLSVNGTMQKKTVSLPRRKDAKKLNFTEPAKVTSLTIDDIVVWSERLEDTSFSDSLSPDNIILRATFQKAISGKGASWYELPVAPFDGSPILVEKQDGTNMRKVSFFDIETGKYRTYNEELFVYNGKDDFVDVAFTDVNEDFFDLMIRTDEGEKVGEPYTIEGKRIHFSLSYTEKQELNRKSLYVRYQLNDSYTIDYNISAVDGYRVDFAKHDGQEKTIYQEGNRWGEPYKLATMIEMNPLLNQNHEGFLYITQNLQETSSFKVTATPEHLLADGGSSSLILIEPVDKEGNYISSADLDVKVKYGHIKRIVSREAADAQKRSGIYIYEYHAPFLSNSKSTKNIEECVWIVDNDVNIGIQYNFLLKPSAKQHPQLYTNDKALADERKSYVFDYLLLYEGLDEHDDPALFDILDLDDNGKVTLEDIDGLESGLLDSQVSGIYSKIKAWEGKQ